MAFRPAARTIVSVCGFGKLVRCDIFGFDHRTKVICLKSSGPATPDLISSKFLLRKYTAFCRVKIGIRQFDDFGSWF